MDQLARKLETARKKAIIKKWLSDVNRFDRLSKYSFNEIDRLYAALPKKINLMHITNGKPLIDIL